MIAFRDPLWLLAALLPPGLWWWRRRQRRPAIRFPTVDGLQLTAERSRSAWLSVPLALRVLALVLMAVALARPRHGEETTKVTSEGIDIVLLVDVSTSMYAEDFTLHGKRVNRLDAVKDVITTFIEHRPNDRIGIVVFAGRPYAAAPLTLDHAWLLSQLDRLDIGMVEDGTGIGSGIAAALNRLRRSKAKSRVIVLLTDGVNNVGAITPEAASQLAGTLGIKLYAVGAGAKGQAPFPRMDVFGRKVYQMVDLPVDDEGLTRIAEVTGGRYFRATDTASLAKVYAQVDAMEKTVMESARYTTYREQYRWLLLPALLLLLIELAIANTWLRILP